jgi:hypothetical protein
MSLNRLAGDPVRAQSTELRFRQTQEVAEYFRIVLTDLRTRPIGPAWCFAELGENGRDLEGFAIYFNRLKHASSDIVGIGHHIFDAVNGTHGHSGSFEFGNDFGGGMGGTPGCKCLVDFLFMNHSPLVMLQRRLVGHIFSTGFLHQAFENGIAVATNDYVLAVRAEVGIGRDDPRDRGA